ncbi:hypothetical protein ACTFIT_003874 [Dictyostelium discoideum]
MFLYVHSQKTNYQKLANEDSIDYYRIDGYMYNCDIENQNVFVSSFGDFECSILNTTTTFPIGCSTNSNLTSYYNCVEEITPTPLSCIISTFGARQCDKTQIIH